MKSPKTARWLFTGCLASLLVVGIYLARNRGLLEKSVSVGSITASPEIFQGKLVRIQGEVSNGYKLPWIAEKYYWLEDETGKIAVQTNQDLPQQGERIRVRGKVDDLAEVNGVHLGVHVVELSRW